MVDADGVVRTRRGERRPTCFAMARGVDAVIAVGVNCTDPAASSRPVAVAAARRGQAGRRLPEQRRGAGTPSPAGGPGPAPRSDDVPAWLAAGARLVGGCCRVRPDDIRAIADAVR